MFPSLFQNDNYFIDTPRLLLRWPCASDVREISNVAGNKLVSEMAVRIPHPFPIPMVEHFINEIQTENKKANQFIAVVALKKSPHIPMGMIGAQKSPEGEVEFGYWLGIKHWNHGYMSEATRYFLDDIFKKTAIPSLISLALITNIVSQKIIYRSGFSLEEENYPYFNPPQLINRYRLTRDAWAAFNNMDS